MEYCSSAPAVYLFPPSLNYWKLLVLLFRLFI